MVYRLYWRCDTGAFAPEAALAEAGAEVELIPVTREEQKSPAYLRLNPMGQVPTLILPDGTLMTESAAMLLVIADSFPTARLMPPPGSSERARVLRWLLFAVSNLYESDLRIYYSDRYTADPAGAEGVAKAALVHHDRCWAMVEEALREGPFVLGADYCLLDLYLAMLASWHGEPRRLWRACPRLARLVRLVAGRPAVAPLWRTHVARDLELPA